MKGSVFATFLVASLAAAAPLNKRSYLTKTVVEEVYETVEVYKTVWVNPGEVAAATTTTPPAQGAFFENHASSAAAPVETSQTPVVYSSPSPTPSSSVAAYTPPVVVAPSSVYTPPAAVTSQTPVQQAYTPTPTPVSSSAPAAVTSSSSSSSGGSSLLPGSYSGDLTWYDTGMGSCGVTSSSTDAIVALSHVLMTPLNGANPNTNPLCGKKINITYGGKTMTATILDTCPGCAEGDLDLSQGLFNELTNYGDGRVYGATWSLA